MALSRGRDQKPQPKSGSKYGTKQNEAEHARLASWSNVSPNALKIFVAAVTANGDAVTFGTTRQGGLMFTVLENDERLREFSSDVDDMEEKMGAYTDAALASVPQQVRERIEELCKGF